MKLLYKPAAGILIVFTLLVSCKKDGYGPISDAPADVPVMVSNLYVYRAYPVVKASKTENQIKIVLAIPDDNPRSIKSVSKIAAQANGNFTAIRDSSVVKPTGLWSNTPVTVNGKSFTFTTNFDEYKTKTGVTTVPTSNALLGRDFYFALVLDNDAVVYPASVRVWVVN